MGAYCFDPLRELEQFVETPSRFERTNLLEILTFQGKPLTSDHFGQSVTTDNWSAMDEWFYALMGLLNVLFWNHQDLIFIFIFI